MPTLYLIPTPIGNLEDITQRALRLFAEVDLLLVEDTRTTGKLLKHYGISVPMKSFHAHNEHAKLPDVVAQIKNGKTTALVTDAGTPGISDPGFLLVRECLKNDIAVECLPGATALIPALAASGLPCARFVFEGFLPRKKGRQTRLLSLQNETRTMVFYESPHRLLKTLTHFAQYFGNQRQACVCRELSKLHEEITRGTIAEIMQHYENRGVKGEIVIVVAGV